MKQAGRQVRELDVAEGTIPDAFRDMPKVISPRERNALIGLAQLAFLHMSQSQNTVFAVGRYERSRDD